MQVSWMIWISLGTHNPTKQTSENSLDYFHIECVARSTVRLRDSGKFIDAEIKCPRSMHDTRVSANCAVHKSYSTGKFKLFYKELLDGPEFVPQLLLGDPAFPFLPYVMKESDHCNSDEHIVFNICYALLPAK